MSLNPFDPLKKEAWDEAYVYFDQRIRPLPKSKNGKFERPERSARVRWKDGTPEAIIEACDLGFKVADRPE